MMTLSQIASAINAQHVGADVMFTSVGADSRHIQAGQLFVALKGEHFDGGTFIAQAFEQGAAAVLVNADANIAQMTKPALIVKDTYQALGLIAQYWRQQFNVPLIAVTGSAGKTTVKEMLSSILQAASRPAQVLATYGNLNNHIGMPMTLLKLTAEHQYAVIEMGMNHSGEIDYLSRIAQPNVALINNAGSAHIGELGSLEAIAKAKGEIFSGLKPNGVAVLNMDDTFAPLWQHLTQHHQHLTFGLKNTADVTASYILKEDTSDIALHTPIGDIAIHLPAPGLHNVYNAIAASVGALAVNTPLNAIKAGLEAYQGVKGRMQHVQGMNGAVIIDDTYNANPVAMKAAIDVLKVRTGKKYVVLGDIGELGENATAMHADVGHYASLTNIDGLLTFGTLSQEMTNAFNRHRKIDMLHIPAQHFSDINMVVNALKPLLQPHTTLLIKGSRFMAMERIVNALRDHSNQSASAPSSETH